MIINKKLTILLCCFFSFMSFAENFAVSDELVYRESKRLKAAGITTISIGSVTTAAGIVTMAKTYKDFHHGSRTDENNPSGGYVAGGLITAMGVGVDLLAIPIFKHRKEIVENARSAAHLIAKPNGVLFVLTF